MTNKELVQVISNLEKACDELMTEFISRKRAADWEIINDALVAGSRARADLMATHQPAKEVKCRVCHLLTASDPCGSCIKSRK